MATVRLLSAGAAQAVCERLIDAYRKDTGHEVHADFGAVGAIKARVLAGEAVDVTILTRPLIDELVGGGWIAPGSQHDLGRVGTGVAVRAGSAIPDVSDAARLKACLLRAGRIVCPDPAIATAGKVVMRAFERLEVQDALRERLRFFPNGYAAMGWLATEGEEGDLGITQDTEIIPNPGVAYVAPLPAELQMKTVYSIGLAARAAEPQLAREFIGLFALSGTRSLLEEAGYELLSHP
jgi:molybdate transport system substrate-binding protein